MIPRCSSLTLTLRTAHELHPAGAADRIVENGQNSWEIQPLDLCNLRGSTKYRDRVPLECSQVPLAPLGPSCQDIYPKTCGVHQSGQLLKKNDHSTKSPINSISHHHKKKSFRASRTLQTVLREEVLLHYPESNHLSRVPNLALYTWLDYCLCLPTLRPNVAFNCDFC